jgi:hypothetical protein
MSSITNRSVPQAAGNPFDLMAGTTSTPIDVLLEIIHNTDEFTMKAYCNKTECM